jgi:hypothetical protein
MARQSSPGKQELQLSRCWLERQWLSPSPELQLYRLPERPLLLSGHRWLLWPELPSLQLLPEPQ